MFCVECGAEGPTVEGVCPSCFAKKHRIVDPPQHVDVRRCNQCGAVQVGNAWIRSDIDVAIPQILREKIPTRKPFIRALFTHEAREEDPNNYSLTVKTMARYEGIEQVQDFHVRLRLKPSLCDVCGKQKSRYYEGIIQVRGDGRDLTPKELRSVRTFVAARIERARDESRDFLSKVEETHGGLDFYVSTNAFSKSLARELAATFGGSVRSSPKLFGMRDGKQVYRVTSLVRLTAFGVGDVVRYKGSLAEVTKIATFVTLRDLASGEERRFRPNDLRGATTVDAERFEAELERTEDGEHLAIHPESSATRPLTSRQPPRGSRAIVVWTSEGAFLSALPADASKD